MPVEIMTVYGPVLKESMTTWSTTAGICNMFERDLKERFAHQRELTYDVQQLFQWMDHLVSLLHALLLLKASYYVPFFCFLLYWQENDSIHAKYRQGINELVLICSMICPPLCKSHLPSLLVCMPTVLTVPKTLPPLAWKCDCAAAKFLYVCVH